MKTQTNKTARQIDGINAHTDYIIAKLCGESLPATRAASGELRNDIISYKILQAHIKNMIKLEVKRRSGKILTGSQIRERFR